MEPVKVSEARKKIEVSLPSITGGRIELYKALTVSDQLELQDEEGKPVAPDSPEGLQRFNRLFALVQKCFIQWNLIDDAGVPVPFLPDTFGKTCTEIDLLFLLQTLGGRQLLNDDLTRILTTEEVQKKGSSAA